MKQSELNVVKQKMARVNIDILGIRELKWMYAKFLQSYLALCNWMDCSLPGASAHGILQAVILDWIAVSSSRGSS